jgi:YD repeat-containing protein
MKDDGQYSVAHVRYDMDGNPIYASYPYFVTSSDWQKDVLPYGVENGESYRVKLSGVSYTYDALGRIIREKTSRGVTEKVYTPNTETLINALGYRTKNAYDAYGNLVQVRENDGAKDIITRYTYDALGRPILLTDALGHIRTWQYDIFGHLIEASDTHTPDDTTYGVRQYSYDLLGRVSTYKNANEETISYTYDALGRPISETM